MHRRSFALLGLLGLGLVAAGSAADAQRRDRDFTVVNRTGSTITHLFVSPTSVSQWGPDQLGSGTLPNGGNYSLHFTPRDFRGQCVFDIKVRIDGNEIAASGINLCTINAVTLTRSGNALNFTAN